MNLQIPGIIDHRLPLLTEAGYLQRQERAKQNLYRALALGNTIAFVGAGTVTNLGYPSWTDAVRDLIRDLGNDCGPSLQQYLESKAEFWSPRTLAWKPETDVGDHYKGLTFGQIFRKRGLCTPKGFRLGCEEVADFKTLLTEYLLRVVAEKADIKDATDISGICKKKLLENLGPDSPHPYSDFCEKFWKNTTILQEKKYSLQPLLELPISRYITTNYDVEIEKMLAEANSNDTTYRDLIGVSSPAVARHKWQETSLSFSQSYDDLSALAEFTLPRLSESPDTPKVFHCHGRLDSPESIIFSESDYQNWYFDDSKENSRAFREMLTLLLCSSPILFLGFGMGDPELLNPLRWLNTLVKGQRFQRPLFRLAERSARASESDCQQYFDSQFQRYGVQTIFYGPSEGNLELKDDLLRAEDINDFLQSQTGRMEVSDRQAQRAFAKKLSPNDLNDSLTPVQQYQKQRYESRSNLLQDELFKLARDYGAYLKEWGQKPPAREEMTSDILSRHPVEQSGNDPDNEYYKSVRERCAWQILSGSQLNMGGSSESKIRKTDHSVYVLQGESGSHVSYIASRLWEALKKTDQIPSISYHYWTCYYPNEFQSALNRVKQSVAAKRCIVFVDQVELILNESEARPGWGQSREFGLRELINLFLQKNPYKSRLILITDLLPVDIAAPVKKEASRDSEDGGIRLYKTGISVDKIPLRSQKDIEKTFSGIEPPPVNIVFPSIQPVPSPTGLAVGSTLAQCFQSVFKKRNTLEGQVLDLLSFAPFGLCLLEAHLKNLKNPETESKELREFHRDIVRNTPNLRLRVTVGKIFAKLDPTLRQGLKILSLFKGPIPSQGIALVQLLLEERLLQSAKSQIAELELLTEEKSIPEAEPEPELDDKEEEKKKQEQEKENKKLVNTVRDAVIDLDAIWQASKELASFDISEMLGNLEEATRDVEPVASKKGAVTQPKASTTTTKRLMNLDEAIEELKAEKKAKRDFSAKRDFGLRNLESIPERLQEIGKLTKKLIDRRLLLELFVGKVAGSASDTEVYRLHKTVRKQGRSLLKNSDISEAIERLLALVEEMETPAEKRRYVRTLYHLLRSNTMPQLNSMCSGYEKSNALKLRLIRLLKNSCEPQQMWETSLQAWSSTSPHEALNLSELHWLYQSTTKGLYIEGGIHDASFLAKQTVTIAKVLDGKEQTELNSMRAALNLACIALDQGRLDCATDYLRRVNRRNQDLPSDSPGKPGLAYYRAEVQGYTALIDHLKGSYPQAASGYKSALEELKDLRNIRARIRFQRHYATLLQRMKESDEASLYLAEAGKRAREGRFKDLELLIEGNRATLEKRLLLKEGKFSQLHRPLAKLQDLLAEAREIGFIRGQLIFRLELAVLYVEQGNFGRAESLAREGLLMAGQFGFGLRKTSFLVALARAASGNAEFKTAKAYASAAEKLARKQGGYRKEQLVILQAQLDRQLS